MFGLFFEVIPLDGHAPRYFELAAALKPELERNGGVLFIDRYTSMDRPDVVLSHSWWESEQALIRWREHSQHRAIQRAGREQHFRDYRIRIAIAIRHDIALHVGLLLRRQAERARWRRVVPQRLPGRKISRCRRRRADQATQVDRHKDLRDHSRLHHA